MKNFDKLVIELSKYPTETPWLEFKHNNYTPKMIGQDISALANSAALYEKRCAYMVWGIDDISHEIVGTKFNLQNVTQGKQELENWLRSMLSDNANFEFHTTIVQEKQVGILIIYAAINQTVTFEKIEYIRIGSYTKKLSDHPSVKMQLWDKLRNSKFEERYAKADVTLPEAIQLLDYTAYFDGVGIPQPMECKGIIHYLLEEHIIAKQDNGLFAITNLGAIAFAKRLEDFPRLQRKAVRIVQYEDKSRMEILKDETFSKGYASSFENVLKYIEALLPTREPIINGLRTKLTAYPMLAVREILANALIHQDFSVTGAGPLVEIFPKRIEITNPGIPLVDVQRIIDNPPKSRNEKLADLMRRLHICEELGTGWDKIVTSCEVRQLPAPKIDVYENSIKVTLFSEILFSHLSPEERIWACYLHACLKQVNGEQMTNSSLRERFGLKKSSSGTISRLIKEAIAKGLVKAVDPDTAPRYMKYIPIWA